jgi:hypothetical protein
MSIGSTNTGGVGLAHSASQSPVLDFSACLGKRERRRKKLAQIAANWDLYLLLAPTIAHFIIFHYIPM